MLPLILNHDYSYLSPEIYLISLFTAIFITPLPTKPDIGVLLIYLV
jgi:hypothetical protein